MNTEIVKVITKHHEFHQFYYPFSNVEAYKKIEKSLRCFTCGQEISDVICIGFAVKGKNKIFHVECAKKLAETYETPIKEDK